MIFTILILPQHFIFVLNFRDLLRNFLLDSNIFGIDVGRDPHNADKVTLVQIYQPNLVLPPGAFDFSKPNTITALQYYQNYLTDVSVK